MSIRSLRLTLAAVALAAAPSYAFAANLVADGDFTNTNGSYATYFSGQSFGPWIVTGGGANAGVDLIGGYWQAPTIAANSGSVDLDGDAPGGISQSLALNPGQWYKLSFYLSGNPDGAPSTKVVNVSVGSLDQNYSYTIGANTHGNMGYILETVSFKAGGSNTLAFNSLDFNTPFGPVVGGVAVSAPELSTWAMMLAGFVCLGFVGYRRNRLPHID